MPNSSQKSRAQATSKALHPCPECLNTMLPGVTSTFPRKEEPTRSTGKVWSYWTGAAVANPPPPNLVDCWRCKGTGLVEERRGGKDRRIDPEGRRQTDDYMGALRAAMRRKRQNTMPNNEGSNGK